MTKTARILVIDANRESMGHYQRLLQAEGYGVEIATFLEVTQEEVERWHPDLIVFDVLVDAAQEQQMWQLIRQFKASPQFASLPILICAAALVLPGFLNYVQDQHIPLLFKPFVIQQLLGAIRALLTLTQSR